MLSPGPRETGTWSAPIAPHGAHRCEITLRPPSGNTVWIRPSPIGTGDSLVTCTPSWSSRPDCTEHVPVSWVSARPAENTAAGPGIGSSVTSLDGGAGVDEAEAELLDADGLMFLGTCRYPSSYPAPSPMTSPATRRMAAPRGG